MAKLCAKGKAAAKRKFKVYPSAYANMYASGVCSGKITPGGKRDKKMGGGMTRPMYKGGGKIEEFGKRIIKGIGKASGLTGPSLARKKFKESVKKDRTKKAKGGLIKGQGCEIR